MKDETLLEALALGVESIAYAVHAIADDDTAARLILRRANTIRRLGGLPQRLRDLSGEECDDPDWGAS